MSSLLFWLYFITYAILLTYIVLGFLVAFEGILAMGGSRFAIKWIRRQFTLAGFIWASKISYPFFLIVYFFFEKLPFILGFDDDLTKFDMDKMIKNIFKDEYRL